jgi:hypothetical protein
MNTQVFEKYYLPFAEALELKELGFSEECYEYYTSTGNRYTDEGGSDNFNMYEGACSIPSYAQAFSFFREKFNLEGTPMSWTEGGKTVWYFSAEPIGKPNIYRGYVCTVDTQEAAQFECVKYLINKAKRK